MDVEVLCVIVLVRMLIIALQVGVVSLMEHSLLVDYIDLNDTLTYGRLKRLLIVSLIEEAGRP